MTRATRAILLGIGALSSACGPDAIDQRLHDQNTDHPADAGSDADAASPPGDDGADAGEGGDAAPPAPDACGSFDAVGGGGYTSGALVGRAWTSINDGSSIAPTDFSSVPAGQSLCVSGSVVPSSSGTAWAILGVLLDEDLRTDVLGDADAGTKASVNLTYVPSSDGLLLSITDRATSPSPLRVCVFGTESSRDPAHGQWCVDYVGQTFFPWGDFVDDFGAGAPYDRQPLESIGVVVPTPEAPTQSFDFCIDRVAEAASYCGCQGASCACPAGKTACAGDCVDTNLDSRNCGSCGHACATDAVCSGGQCLDSLAPAQSNPFAIALDSANVYFANYLDGTVVSLPRAGGSPTTLAKGQDVPRGLAVDGQNVYWLNEGTAAMHYADGAVMKAPLTGGPAVTLATGQPNPLGIAIDGASVYWTNEGVSLGGSADGSVMKVGHDGTGLVTLANAQADPEGIAVDANNVYWASSGTTGNNHGDGAITKVLLDGSSTTPLATMQSFPVGLALDAGNVYFTSVTGDVMKVALTGGPVTTLAARQSHPFGIQVHAGNAYFTNNEGGSLMRVPVGGGTPVTLAAGRNYAYDIAVDDLGVYWTEGDGVGLGGMVTVAP